MSARGASRQVPLAAHRMSDPRTNHGEKRERVSYGSCVVASCVFVFHHKNTNHRRSRCEASERARAAQALTRPNVFAFSSEVWKRPCPNLEEVSMNLSLISSVATRLVWGNNERRSVISLLRGPAMPPLIIR